VGTAGALCYARTVTRRRQGAAPFDASQLRITRGALILLFLEVGISLIFYMSSKATKLQLIDVLVPSSEGVWREWKLWTLATGPLIETSFTALIFQALLLWLFVPQLERWWGTKRFLTFAALTSLAGSVAGTLGGLVVSGPPIIDGLDPFLYASIVAFGIIYAKQPVRFFGVLPMTGRQLMYGILGFLTLFVVLEAKWSEGLAFLAAILVAVMLTSERWSPRLAWLRWKQRRARAHLDILQGGLGGGGKTPNKPGKNDKRWVN
jgi:membrane associated rhomboid family serine protease